MDPSLSLEEACILLFPPNPRARLLVILIPKPAPVVFKYYPVSLSPNVSNNLFNNFSGIPHPVSLTSILIISLDSSKTLTVIDPLTVNFKEFDNKFNNTYLILLESELI